MRTAVDSIEPRAVFKQFSFDFGHSAPEIIERETPVCDWTLIGNGDCT
jgi:hypothetical protein